MPQKEVNREIHGFLKFPVPAIQKVVNVACFIKGFHMLGIHEIEVSRKPKAIIIVTGNELIPPGEPLTSGKIYESNSYTLKAALKSVGVEAEIQSVKDDFESTKSMISMALSECDLVITSGGISVGDYDFVGKAMNELKVNEVFYKLKQKPGKPLFFVRFRLYFKNLSRNFT